MKTFNLLTIFSFIVLISCQRESFEPDENKTIILDEKSAQLVEAENKFGLEFFQNIYTSETEYENIMVSPLSVSLALAMTYNGANGETQTAMEKTLKVYGLTPDDINKSYSNLVAALKSLDPKVLLEIANAIFYRDDFQVENDFVSINRNYYDAEVSALDFGSPEALKTINGWVADNTHDKIETILDRIDRDHVMFLLNAIYFKGIWKSEFETKDTKELLFYIEDGSTIHIPTMQKSDTISYTTNNLFSAVRLPYGAGNYNMYLFLPHQENSAQDIVDKLDTDKWAEWMDSFSEPVNVDLKIPRFKYEYEIKLNDVLTDMGMGIAFTEAADFTGINKNGQLYIDYVKHKTFIEVNEEGTEAAVVTVVAVVRETSAGTQNIPFYVNRPFLYAITEKDTGAILFIGTVKNPQLN